MDLFQHLIDVDGIGLLARLSPLLLVGGGLAFAGSGGFLSSLGSYFGRHNEVEVQVKLRNSA